MLNKQYKDAPVLAVSVSELKLWNFSFQTLFYYFSIPTEISGGLVAMLLLLILL